MKKQNFIFMSFSFFLIFALFFSQLAHAAFQLESRGESCDLQKTFELPSINMSCNADSRSGNASNWLNPNTACDMSFEMLSLPSLGDITAGLAAGVCKALQGLKEMTYDQAIGQINDKIPEDVLGDLDLDLDLSDHVTIGD